MFGWIVMGTIRLDLEEFSGIARAENTFLVLPGGEDVRVEEVVDRNGHLFVVQKRRRAIEAVS
jgi:hypothetical protein